VESEGNGAKRREENVAERVGVPRSCCSQRVGRCPRSSGSFIPCSGFSTFKARSLRPLADFLHIRSQRLFKARAKQVERRDFTQSGCRAFASSEERRGTNDWRTHELLEERSRHSCVNKGGGRERRGCDSAIARCPGPASRQHTAHQHMWSR